MATADVAGLIAWIREFAERHASSRIVFAYEASGRGFGLHDALTEAGIECHVLAPTHLPRTAHRRKNKTDEKDAQVILEELRAYVLAGRKLPRVWVPDFRKPPVLQMCCIFGAPSGSDWHCATLSDTA